jgi:hypothetical protein
MAAPYPNFSPNYTTVRKHGGYTRDCIVLELSTLDEMDPARRAMLEDAIAVAISKFQDIEKHKIVRSEDFNTELLRALRL